mmetsp:Transcript_11377/g.25935  ORF Transcript_11377/g.25935 Transcript_11377/m.25935 type:complete len:242 (+) Transcript_11377:5114-5839(+)
MPSWAVQPLPEEVAVLGLSCWVLLELAGSDCLLAVSPRHLERQHLPDRLLQLLRAGRGQADCARGGGKEQRLQVLQRVSLPCERAGPRRVPLVCSWRQRLRAVQGLCSVGLPGVSESLRSRSLGVHRPRRRGSLRLLRLGNTLHHPDRAVRARLLHRRVPLGLGIQSVRAAGDAAERGDRHAQPEPAPDAAVPLLEHPLGQPGAQGLQQPLRLHPLGLADAGPPRLQRLDPRGPPRPLHHP